MIATVSDAHAVVRLLGSPRDLRIRSRRPYVLRSLSRTWALHLTEPLAMRSR